MKVFLLIHEQDTDAAWGANADSFISLEAAQAAMQKSYEDSIKSWDFDTTEQTDEHYSECLEKSAMLRDDSDVEKWRIEERELDVQVAIEVEGGMVQTIYTNADDLYPDVFDLDTSDFSTETEEREVDVLRRELNEMVNAPWMEGGRMREIYKAILSHLLQHHQKYGLTGKQKSQLEAMITKL